jgi:hypothetical protein
MISIEAALYCIREFQEITNELNYNTGDELFKNFRRILRGAAKDDWDSISWSRSPCHSTNKTHIIFRAMPITWQTNFLRSNGDVSNSSVLQLQQFMSQERESAEQAQNIRGRNSLLNSTSSRNTQNRQRSHERYSGQFRGTAWWKE